MTWLLTLAVGVATAVAGCVGAGVLGGLCAAWYRITTREGAAGYYVVAIALAGLVGGFGIGLVTARVVAAGTAPTFLRALGLSLSVLAALLILIGGIAWLGADFPPKIGGRELVVEVEVRFPPRFTVPVVDANEGYHWSVSITADHGARSQRSGDLRMADARREEGRAVVPATVSLQTSDEGKSLGVTLGEAQAQFFRFPLPGKPTSADMAWSPWMTTPTLGNLTPVPDADAVAVRYRVQLYVAPPPEPPGPSDEEIEAKKKAEEDAAYAALTPEAPIDAWLRFTHYAQPQERREAAAAAIARRPGIVAELSPLLLSDDRALSDLALRSVSLMKPPPEGLGSAVIEVGRRIAAEIRVVNATTVEEDPSYQKAADAGVRFAGWSEAARVLHGRPGVDMRPVMREILDLARVRGESLMMMDVVRVSGFWTKEWSGGAKP